MANGKRYLETACWLLQLASRERFRTKRGWVKSWLQKVRGTLMRPTTLVRLPCRLHKMQRNQKLAQFPSIKLNHLLVRRSLLLQQANVPRWPAQTGGSIRWRRQLTAAPVWTKWHMVRSENCELSSPATTPSLLRTFAIQRSSQLLRRFR